MGETKLSIIVPVHNGGDYLAECLASIECQTLSQIEVLCVDDASTDDSASIIVAFAERDPRFKLISLPSNQGAAAARNQALTQASGEFVAFMDADDWYPKPTTLERLVRAATENGVDIAGGSFSEYDMETGLTKTDFSEEEHLRACFTFEQEGIINYRDWQGDYGFTRFVYRRALLEEHGITFPIIARHEDPVFFVRVMLAAGRFYAIPDVVYVCRVGHKELLISERALSDSVKAICDIIEISVQEDLPILRSYQYDLLHWYSLDAPIKREYANWAEIGDIVKRQAQDSLRLRLNRISRDTDS